MTTYANTPKTEAALGWRMVPESCDGDPAAKYVTHDERRGRFYFHDRREVQQ